MLEAKDIILEFSGKRVLNVRYISFAAASISLLCGKNASGKTMLFEVLSGLREANSGEVFLDGSTYPHKNQQLGTGVGIVFQQAEKQIIEQSVEDEILFGVDNIPELKVRRSEIVEEMLLWSGLCEKRTLHPSKLSGGELRKLSIASVLAMLPKFILLDEPFDNLDYEGVKLVLNGILKLRSLGHGVVIITHDLEKCLAHADYLYVLQDGKLIFNEVVSSFMHFPDDLGIRIPQSFSTNSLHISKDKEQEDIHSKSKRIYTPLLTWL